MRRPKKILFIARYLWGDEGISVHITRLAQGLINLGWKVGLAAAIDTNPIKRSDKYSIEKFASLQIQFYFIPFPNKINNLRGCLNFINAFNELSSVIKDFDPDLLHIHSLSVSFR